MTLLYVVLALLAAFLAAEVVLRFHRLRHCPFTVRLAYSSFLLSRAKFEENYATAQRVIRGGFRDCNQLFDHYAKISGKSKEEIRRKFGSEPGWKAIFARKYSSGGHGLMEQVQKMHIGMVPKPNQSLQVLEIDEQGRRRTGRGAAARAQAHHQKTCILLGGSAAMGIGATSDSGTVAAGLERYLNEKSSHDYRVVNLGMMGFSSFQELLSLLQSDVRPDLVVTLSGANEVDQALRQGGGKVSGLAAACDSRANRSVYRTAVSDVLQRFMVLGVARRFIEAFLAFEEEDKPPAAVRRAPANSAADRLYPLF